MNIACKVFSVAALLLAAVATAADKPAPPTEESAPYTIKLKSFPDAGKSYVVHTTDKITSVTRGMDAKGKPLPENKIEQGNEEVYTVTVLVAGDPLPKKFKQVYEKAVSSLNKATTKKSYHGRTVVYERKKDKYEVTVEGDPPLLEDDLKELRDRANAESSDPLPKKPVKVGDVWVIAGKELAPFVGKDDKLDDQSKITGKLVKVTDKDGKKIGVIQTKWHIVTTAMNGKKLPGPNVSDSDETLEAVIDGSSLARKIRTVSMYKMPLEGELPQTAFTEITTETEYSAEK